MNCCGVCEARRAFLRELAERFKGETEPGKTFGAPVPTKLALAANQLLEAEKA